MVKRVWTCVHQRVSRFIMSVGTRQRVVNGVRVYIPGHSSHYSPNATYVRKSVYSHAGDKNIEMIKG